MTEYIDKNKIKESLAWHDQQNMISGMEDILDIIDEEPVADGAPVKHGKWKVKPCIKSVKHVNIPVVECSVCGLYFCDIINNHNFIYRYCPSCGAEMDLEEQL